MTEPSSTSSSEVAPSGVLAKGLRQVTCRPPPTGGHLRLLIATLAVVAVALGAWEVTVRARGYLPSVTDDKDLWATTRLAVDDDPQTLVLLGKSRMLMGFSPAAFRQRYPEWSLHHLAVQGMGAWATLKDLAEDDAFRGVVIMEMTPVDVTPQAHESQTPWVKRAKEMTLDQRGHVALRTRLQERLAFLHPRVRLDQTIPSLWNRGKIPDPGFILNFADRHQEADFEKVDAGKLARHFENNRIAQARRARGRTNPDFWFTFAIQIEPLVEKIQRRGGKVVFAVFPVSGGSIRFADLFYPKDQFWDRFATFTKATTVHWRDVPTMAFECPDTNHLDKRDTGPFTDALLNELIRKRALPAP